MFGGHSFLSADAGERLIDEAFRNARVIRQMDGQAAVARLQLFSLSPQENPRRYSRLCPGTIPHGHKVAAMGGNLQALGACA